MIASFRRSSTSDKLLFKRRKTCYFLFTFSKIYKHALRCNFNFCYFFTNLTITPIESLYVGMDVSVKLILAELFPESPGIDAFTPILCTNSSVMDCSPPIFHQLCCSAHGNRQPNRFIACPDYSLTCRHSLPKQQLHFPFTKQTNL